MTIEKNKPIETLRDGRLKVAIWANQTEKGTRYSLNLTYNYPTQDGNWRDTHYLPEREFLRGSHLLSQAHNRVREIKLENKQQVNEGAQS